ncbi:hypothetical protein ACWDAO_15145 [Streptomyces sp. NPDC001212]
MLDRAARQHLQDSLHCDVDLVRLRNSIEGYNGYAKNPLAEGIESAGSRRIRGTAATDGPAVALLVPSASMLP